MVITGIVIVVATFIAIIKQFETRLVLLLSGLLMCFIGGQLGAGTTAFVKELTNPGLVPTICTVLGFSYVMEYTKCTEHMVYFISAGLKKMTGFGMLLSGIVAAILFHQPNSYAMWDVWTVIGCFNVVFLGTIVSFNAYLEGVKRIGAVPGSILSSIEPISAAFFGWALLDNQFSALGLIGMAMIIATVIIIALEKRT